MGSLCGSVTIISSEYSSWSSEYSSGGVVGSDVVGSGAIGTGSSSQGGSSPQPY